MKNIYKARMNQRAFDFTKNLHLIWYTYAIKALLGQVGKQIYGQLNDGWLFIQLGMLFNISLLDNIHAFFR